MASNDEAQTRPTAQLSTLKINRGRIKSKLTRFENYLDSITDAELHSDARLLFENDYFSLTARANLLMSPLSVGNLTVPSISGESNNNNGQSMSHICSQQSQINAQLPPIPLPVFSGNVKEWHKFENAFKAFVNKNSSLSRYEKFAYLRGALKDDALKVIEEMEEVEENYESALEILKARFDRKKIIKTAHVDAILAIHSMTKECSRSLRMFVDDLNLHLRALKNLGEQVDTWDLLLLRLLSPKLIFAPDAIGKRLLLSWMIQNSTISRSF